MPRRIVLDSAFLSRVKKEDDAYVSTLSTMTLKKNTVQILQVFNNN